MNVLLFEDHELFANLMESALTPHFTSFRSYTNHDENSIINIVNQQPEAIILMDIRLGKVDGLKVAEKLLQQNPKLKIIFLSGYDLPTYHNKAIHMGAKGFVTKSASLEELIAKIQLVGNGQIIFPKYTQEVEALTKQEEQILRLISEGRRQQDVADELMISRRTVSKHLEVIVSKLGVTSTIAATVRGIQLGIIAAEDLHSYERNM